MTRTARRWTPDEITKLKEMAGKHPRDTIAEQLGRAGSAVAMKAHELRLSLRYQLAHPRASADKARAKQNCAA